MPDPIVNPAPAAAAPPPAPAPAPAVPAAPAPQPAPDPIPAAPAPVQPDANWRDSLPESVRAWEEVTTAKSAEDFWKGQDNVRAMIGNSVRIPSSEAGPEDWAAVQDKLHSLMPGKLLAIPNRDNPAELKAYYNALGVPEDASGYLDVVSTDDNVIDVQTAGAFKAIAHKHGLTPEQYMGVVADYNAMQNSAAEVAAQPMEDGLLSLRGEWGQAYDKRTETLTSMMATFKFPQAAIDAFKGGKGDAGSMRALYALAEALGGEGGGIIDPAPGGGARAALTPVEAELRIAEIMRGPDYKSTDPATRRAAVEKMVELQMFVTDTAREKVVFNTR